MWYNGSLRILQKVTGRCRGLYKQLKERHGFQLETNPNKKNETWWHLVVCHKITKHPGNWAPKITDLSLELTLPLNHVWVLCLHLSSSAWFEAFGRSRPQGGQGNACHPSPGARGSYSMWSNGVLSNSPQYFDGFSSETLLFENLHCLLFGSYFLNQSNARSVLYYSVHHVPSGKISACVVDIKEPGSVPQTFIHPYKTCLIQFANHIGSSLFMNAAGPQLEVSRQAMIFSSKVVLGCMWTWQPEMMNSVFCPWGR